VRLIRLIRRERPDVVYVNTVTIPWWILAARLAAVPVVAHVHEAEEDSPRLIRLGLNAPMLLARRVISNSRSSAEVVAAAVPRLARRTVVVPNGVPDRGALPRDAVHPGRLVLVGRLSPRKGTDVALEALALVRRTRPEASLVLCGTAFEGYEWFEAQLRGRAAAPDLDGAVEFAGYVESTAPVLASAEVVLVPSRTEPFGNTAVEAELAERPLVASGVQGLAEIVQDGRTGLLVPPGDAPALAAAVERVLADPELATRLARDGRADALARFSTERYQRDIVTVLTSARRGVRA
jgi:glycosyltransferase involved in cell wall biosynthesis